MALAATQKMKNYRTKLRDLGLRPVQIWVHDTHRDDFSDECRRQSLLIKGDSCEKEILDWIEDASDLSGWER